MKILTNSPTIFYARQTAWLLLVACLIVLANGCRSQDWKKTTNRVFGKVIINGQPAKDVIVKLYSQSGPIDRRESVPWGLTNAEGVFNLTTYKQNDGVPEGTYRVSLKWPKDKSKPSPDKLDGMYSDPATSPFEIVVRRGKNDLPPFELTHPKAGK